MLIFYDLETTGLNQFHDKITELCFIKQSHPDFKDEKFVTLINPEKAIPEIVTKITGIDQSMVANKLTFNQINEQLIHFINSVNAEISFLIAHNNDNYDKLMLTSHFKNAGVDIKKYNWVFLDTLLIAKKLYPQFKKYNLKSLCEQLGVSTLSAHRAEADTIMLKNLYYRMLLDLEKEMDVDLQELIENPQLVYNYYN